MIIGKNIIIHQLEIGDGELFKEIGIIRKGSYNCTDAELKDVLYMDILKEEWIETKKSY